MFTLLILILFGGLAAYFATQNTQAVSITLASNIFPNIPLYVIVLVALFIGILVSFVISLVGSFSSSLTIFSKDSKIKETKREVAELTKRIHHLELENTELKTELHKPVDEKSL